MRQFALHVLASLIASSISAAGPLLLKGRDSYVNPLIPGYYADPNIAVFDDQYYIYPTLDGFPGWAGQQFFVWMSSDLVTWTRTEDPFLTLNGTSGNVPWAIGNAWAPTIVERNAKYYFYFSGNNPTYNQKTIGAAVGETPLGPFTAEPEAMITNNETLKVNQAIDPCAFVDPKSGKHYLYWGNGPHPLVAELCEDMVSINWDTVQVVQGLTNFTEASFVVYREPYYHYTFSVGDTNDANYHVGYATSTNATGPFTYHGVVLQEDPSLGILATGSNSIINVPRTDDWYMAYHRFAIPNGNGTQRETTLDRVTFDAETGLMNAIVTTLNDAGAQSMPVHY